MVFAYFLSFVGLSSPISANRTQTLGLQLIVTDDTGASTDDDDKTSGMWAIIIGVIGGVGILVLIFCCVRIQKQKNDQRADNSMEMGPIPSGSR